MVQKLAVEENVDRQDMDNPMTPKPALVEKPGGTLRYDSVLGTMRIDPNHYKKFRNTHLFGRTKYAVAGLLYMVRREKSIQNVMKVAFIVFGLAFWLKIPYMHVMMLILAFALLWTIETMNSAIEAVVDMVSPDFHEMAKVAKDVAASATFIATLTAATTSLVFVLPPLLDKIDALLAQ